MIRFLILVLLSIQSTFLLSQSSDSLFKISPREMQTGSAAKGAMIFLIDKYEVF